MLTRRCAVLGSPIGHSLSPRLHRAAYAALGLDWRYDSYDVDVDGLPGFVAGLGAEWVGLSLTMPLKAAGLAVADEAAPVARRVGAANTLLLGQRRLALNTDVPALQRLLADHGFGTGAAAVDSHRPRGRTATVLGGGATARSALVALADRVTDVVVMVRDPARVGDLHQLGLPYSVRVADLGVSPARSAALARQLVVSTAPTGALDHLADEVGAADDRSDGEARLFVDVGYDRWPTGLAAAYEATGRTVVGGLDLLVRQAALQVEAMTGRPAPLREMWAAVRPSA